MPIIPQKGHPVISWPFPSHPQIFPNEVFLCFPEQDLINLRLKQQQQKVSPPVQSNDVQRKVKILLWEPTGQI